MAAHTGSINCPSVVPAESTTTTWSVSRDAGVVDRAGQSCRSVRDPFSPSSGSRVQAPALGSDERGASRDAAATISRRQARSAAAIRGDPGSVATAIIGQEATTPQADGTGGVTCRSTRGTRLITVGPNGVGRVLGIVATPSIQELPMPPHRRARYAIPGMGRQINPKARSQSLRRVRPSPGSRTTDHRSHSQRFRRSDCGTPGCATRAPSSRRAR